MNISVASEYKKIGIGKKLLQYVIKSTRDNKVKQLELGTETFGYQLAFTNVKVLGSTQLKKLFFNLLQRTNL